MLCNNLWEKEFSINDIESNENSPILNLKEIESLFDRKIFDIYGCLILDSTLDRSRNITITQEQFKKVIQHYGDKTGYEYSNNEFRIIDYVEKNLSKEEQYILTMTYIKYLNTRTTLMTQNKVIYILIFNDEILQIRFYQEWDKEDSSYIENIETSDSPMAIYTSVELSDGLNDDI